MNIEESQDAGCKEPRSLAQVAKLPGGLMGAMRGRSAGSEGGPMGAFGHRVSGGLERAFDLRDPYKLNRAPMLRGGKRRLSSLGSIVCALLGVALLIGSGVLIGRELVRPPRRSWEGELLNKLFFAIHCVAQSVCKIFRQV